MRTPILAALFVVPFAAGCGGSPHMAGQRDAGDDALAVYDAELTPEAADLDAPGEADDSPVVDAGSPYPDGESCCAACAASWVTCCASCESTCAEVGEDAGSCARLCATGAPATSSCNAILMDCNAGACGGSSMCPVVPAECPVLEANDAGGAG
jgi:hypothetical protein